MFSDNTSGHVFTCSVNTKSETTESLKQRVQWVEWQTDGRVEKMFLTAAGNVSRA